MAKFDKEIEHLEAYIRQATEDLKELEGGTLRHYEAKGSEQMVEVTDRWIARYKFDIERFTELIAAYKRLEQRD